MEPAFVFGGLFLLLVGAYPTLFPHRAHNYVSSREWEDDPRGARRKQERYARLVGGAIALGLPLLVAGVVL
ncbi:hypothetical protein [Halogeometricum sp. CBA1124]|uniref:hypothetical protein n=1 Tax=Halogeometricum sp. CBA1124 TaxID=2668071 RepID=UPI00142C7018|nr:hypothetical protein [Halogeometricum sp. CBA1124]MUV57338.1 hypothetical protein [Halogeometricum sp. CBA1124]